MSEDKKQTAGEMLEKFASIGHDIRELADNISDAIGGIDKLFSETAREGFDELIGAGLVPGATFTSAIVAGDLVVVGYSVAYPCRAVAILRCMDGDSKGKEHHVHIDMFRNLVERGNLTRKG